MGGFEGAARHAIEWAQVAQIVGFVDFVCGGRDSAARAAARRKSAKSGGKLAGGIFIKSELWGIFEKFLVNTEIGISLGTMGLPS